MPIKPVPNNAKVAGSGTNSCASPLRIVRIGLFGSVKSRKIVATQPFEPGPPFSPIKAMKPGSITPEICPYSCERGLPRSVHTAAVPAGSGPLFKGFGPQVGQGFVPDVCIGTKVP